MKAIYWSIMLSLFISLALVGCALLVIEEDVDSHVLDVNGNVLGKARDQATGITDVGRLRDLACPLTDVITVTKVMIPTKHWAFHLTYDATDNPIDPMEDGNPLGCFRVYEVDINMNTATNSFAKPIDGGGFIANTCAKTQGVTITNGEALFNGGYITCTMNMRQWFNNIAGNVLNPTGQIFDFSGFDVNQQIYNTFTIKAEGSIFPTGTNDPSEYENKRIYPVIAYENAIAMSLQTYTETIGLGENEEQPTEPYLTFLANINGQFYQPQDLPDDPNDNNVANDNCSIDLQDDTKHEFQFWQDITSSQLRFAWPDENGIRWCDSPAISQVGSLNFPLDEVTLFIGTDPAQQTKFYGTLRDTILDPCDSKPSPGG